MQLSRTVTLDHQGDIALIAIDNPPVNAAGAEVRAGLVAAVAWLRDTPGVRAAALFARGRTFIAGADIREFGKPPVDPWLPEVCQILEDCPTPIACILHGTTLGGGLEVALACHSRIALPGTRVGLPEVHLGILPGAGGTQRAPRLTGIPFAVEAITTGRHIPAEEARAAGLIDAIWTEPGPPEAAARAARALADGLLDWRRTGDLTVAPDDAALQAARDHLATRQPHLFSPLKCVEAVAASTLPLPEGLAEERRLFQLCMDSPQRAGLIHAFFAERAVARIPEADATPRPLTRIGIVGAGTMGSGIATACLLAGLPVILTDTAPQALDRARATVAGNLDGAVRRGKLDTAARAKAEAALSTTTDLTALAPADLIIEAAVEDMSVKQALFRDLDAIARPGTVLATNTSYLDVNQIAAATTRPQDVLGLHFFSPAHVMRLLELVVADQTAPEAAATGLALAKRLKKIAVRSGVCDGFIGNRILMSTRNAMETLMLDGADFPRIDAALEGWGLAMGPFRVSDLAGLDIAWAQRKRRAATRHPDTRYTEVADRLCEQGMLGRKSGAGYYLDTGGPNPAALAALAQERARKGISPRAFTDAEIADRYLTAMILEAARIVEEGVALRPIDVDAVLLFGYGFPRHLGGPLFQADALGAARISDHIARYAADDPAFWQVPDVLAEMARGTRRFADLNA